MWSVAKQYQRKAKKEAPEHLWHHHAIKSMHIRITTRHLKGVTLQKRCVPLHHYIAGIGLSILWPKRCSLEYEMVEGGSGRRWPLAFGICIGLSMPHTRKMWHRSYRTRIRLMKMDFWTQYRNVEPPPPGSELLRQTPQRKRQVKKGKQDTTSQWTPTSCCMQIVFGNVDSALLIKCIFSSYYTYVKRND